MNTYSHVGLYILFMFTLNTTSEGAMHESANIMFCRRYEYRNITLSERSARILWNNSVFVYVVNIRSSSREKPGLKHSLSLHIYFCASFPKCLGSIVKHFGFHTFLDADMKIWAFIWTAVVDNTAFAKVEAPFAIPLPFSVLIRILGWNDLQNPPKRI